MRCSSVANTIHLAEVGEAWVLFRLAAHGIEAYRSAGGFAHVDIRAVEPRFDLQVKTATSPSWQLTTRDDDDAIAHSPTLFYVLVQLVPPSEHEATVDRAFVIPSAVVHQFSRAANRAWRAKHPDGKPRGRWLKESYGDLRVPAQLAPGYLDPYLDAWELLPT